MKASICKCPAGWNWPSVISRLWAWDQKEPHIAPVSAAQVLVNRSSKESILFFSLIVFGGTEVPIVYILLCCPSEDSLQQSAFPDGSPSKDWQSTVGWGDCWIRTQDCSFTIWCRYKWATTGKYTNPQLGGYINGHCHAARSRMWLLRQPIGERKSLRHANAVVGSSCAFT